jgi:glycosyltransferase involved in cell wall biosynthesis
MITRTLYINGRYVTQPMSGVQRYAHEIVGAIDGIAKDTIGGMTFVLLTPKGAPKANLRNIKQREVGGLTGHLWDQISFAWAARSGTALSLAMTGPILHPRHIVVIHDAAVQRHPEHFSKVYTLAHGVIDRLLSKTATVATVSEFSRRELAEVLHMDARNIIVAPNGAEHLALGNDDGDDVVERLGLSNTPYFIVLCNITRNKNLAVAIRALGALPLGTCKLVAVGRLDAAVFGQGYLPPMHPDLMLAGRLDDEEVSGLLRGAKALIFPSLYEGFGIPPLEAMINDCPVLASTAEAVVEVCGDAAEYFEPHDDAELARLMAMVLRDDGVWRAERNAKGKLRLAKYSWRASADTLVRAAQALSRGRKGARP